MTYEDASHACRADRFPCSEYRTNDNCSSHVPSGLYKLSNVIVAVALAALLLDGCVSQNSVDTATMDSPFRGYVSDIGYSSVSDWAKALDAEHRAMLDLAYNDACAKGYSGSFNEWAENSIKAHRDSDGDLVVVLADGGQFTITVSSGNSARSSTNDFQSKEVHSTSGEASSSDANEVLRVEDALPDESTLSMSDNNLSPILNVDTAEARIGELVDIPVKLEGNPGILGLEFSVSYDEGGLELVGADNGEAFKSVLSMTSSPDKSTGCKFAWDGVEVSPNDVKDGSVLVMHFKVKSDAKPGFHSVVLRNQMALNNSLDEVALTCEDGGVVVD